MAEKDACSANARQIGVAMLCGVSFLISMLPASANSSQDLAKAAKITAEEARAIALKAQPGRVTDEELEKEVGGSGLRYSFDIKNGVTIYEVGVDAMTGAVLENVAEGINPD